jgi:SHS2 domain-containing protein
VHPAHPCWLEILEHTADTGIQITAPDLPELFSRAAWSMFTVISNPPEIGSTLSRTVAVDSSDLPSLMVRWLSELNYLHTIHRELYSEFEVNLRGETRLEARVRGEPIDLSRHSLHTEIKAVTYHQLHVTQEQNHWRAQVLFDL